MAGQIDFGLLTTPNFLGDALRYQKAGQQQRDDERLRRARATGDIATIREIDPDEAAAMERSQQTGADRQAKITGAQSAARGDWQGARTAYASAGDIGAVNDVDALHEASTRKVAAEAQFLKGIFDKDGPEAALAAFDQRASTYGADPQQIADIRAKIAANPEVALTALAGAPTYKYQRDPNTGAIIGIDEATGEAKEIYKGTPRASSGYTYDEDGNMTYIRGGPRDPEVIAREAGVRRQAVVDRPTKKTGGKASTGSKAKAYTPDAIKWD